MQPANPRTQEPYSWPPAGWLTKKTAAERLGLSESRIAAMGTRVWVDPMPLHSIKTRADRNPTSKQVVTLFHEGDVERVAFERQNPEATKVPTTVDKPLNYSDPPAWARMIAAPQIAAKPDKPWITVDEAAEYSGLPASVVLKLIESGSIPAVDCGPRPGGRYRVTRKALDSFEGHR